MKFAIFVEGQTEVIFISALLRNWFNRGQIQVTAQKLYHKATQMQFSARVAEGQWAEHLCLIVDTSGDETVLSRMRENYADMLDRGFGALFGLRDVGAAYKEFGDAVIEKSRAALAQYAHSNKASLHFAKMETEAWFLASPSLFTRVDDRLDCEYIKQETGVDLDAIDPQEKVSEPSKLLRRILRAVGRNYGKHEDEVKAVVGDIDWEELCFEARERGKVSFFFEFLDDLERTII